MATHSKLCSSVSAWLGVFASNYIRKMDIGRNYLLPNIFELKL